MQWIHYFLFTLPTMIGGYYFGKKISHLLTLDTKRKKGIFWIVLWTFVLLSVLTLSPIVVWIAYTIFLFLLSDFLTLLFQKLQWQKCQQILKKLCTKGLTIFVLALAITVYGVWNANHPMIENFTIEINKKMERDLKIVLLTDLHLGTGSNESTIDRIVQTVNNQHADLFIIAGDLFDEMTKKNLKEYAYKHLGKTTTTYGTYYIEGNHDLLNEKTRTQFLENNIRTVEDEILWIDQTFYLIGRKDLKHKRKALEELTKNIDRNYPIILVDHRPVDETHAKKEGVDLQLAGHTHAGQLFPGNFFLKNGYHKDENYHLIVSAGYGNWGIAIRTAKQNELVTITLKKKGS